MNMTEKEVEEYNRNIIKRILKSILYTFALIFFINLILMFISSILGDMPEAFLYIGMFLTLIFTMFYCTLTIIDEIKKLRRD